MTEYQNQILDKLKSHHCVLESNGDNTLLWEYLISEILKGKRRIWVVIPKHDVKSVRNTFLEYYDEKKSSNQDLPSYDQKSDIIFKDKNHSDILFTSENSHSGIGRGFDVMVFFDYDNFKHQKLHQTCIPLANARNGRFIATAKKLVKLPLSDLLGVGGCKVYSL